MTARWNWLSASFSKAPGRAEFEARLAANPEGSASRKLQEALAARGWTGTRIDVGPSQGAARCAELYRFHT